MDALPALVVTSLLLPLRAGIARYTSSVFWAPPRHVGPRVARSATSRARAGRFGRIRAPRAASGSGARVHATAIVAILIAELPLNAITIRLLGEAEILTGS
jgi:hypothetical protein